MWRIVVCALLASGCGHTVAGLAPESIIAAAPVPTNIPDDVSNRAAIEWVEAGQPEAIRQVVHACVIDRKNMQVFLDGLEGML